MRRLIKLCFVISDAVAWFVVMTGLVIVVIFPIVAPVHASYQRLMGEQPVSELFIASVVATTLLTVLGAFLLSRRKYQGLLLVMFFCLPWMTHGQTYPSLVYACFMATTFGLPLLLSYLEAIREEQ